MAAWTVPVEATAEEFRPDPADSGATATLQLVHDFGMTGEMNLELLSPPYKSRKEVLFFGYRLGLINASQGPGNDGIELKVIQDNDLRLQPLGRLR